MFSTPPVSPPSRIAEAKNSGAIPARLHTSSYIGFNKLKHRDNPSGLQIKMLHALTIPMRTACPFHHTLLDLLLQK
jgi:hypothetical protein